MRHVLSLAAMSISLFLGLACSSEPSSPAASGSGGGSSGISSSSSSATSSGAAGQGGQGGAGGAAPDDAVLCTTLAAMTPPEPLVAGIDAANAPAMSAPDILYNVQIPPAGGFVSLTLPNPHTTFVVYASGQDALSLLLDGKPLSEQSNAAICEGEVFQRIEHHSHTPVTFVVALPGTSIAERTVFYHLQ